MAKPVTPPERSEMVQLHEAGHTIGQIAHALGRGRQVVLEHLAAAGTITPRPPGGLTEDAAAYAQMLATSAYTAAQTGDRQRALELIRDADKAAQRLPDQPVPGQPFTRSPSTRSASTGPSATPEPP